MMLCCRTQQHFKHPLQTRNRQEFQSDFTMENFQNTTRVRDNGFMQTARCFLFMPSKLSSHVCETRVSRIWDTCPTYVGRSFHLGEKRTLTA